MLYARYLFFEYLSRFIKFHISKLTIPQVFSGPLSLLINITNIKIFVSGVIHFILQFGKFKSYENNKMSYFIVSKFYDDFV